MELRTFGVALKFAMDLEAIASAFYETAVVITTSQDLKGLFETLLLRGQKRINLLLRVRRENTTEMILEPISGLDGDQYRPKTEIPKGAGDAALSRLAEALELLVHDFYKDAAEKISFLSEPASVFERLADENAENANRLKNAI
jgi:rubrerythrin